MCSNAAVFYIVPHYLTALLALLSGIIDDSDPFDLIISGCKSILIHPTGSNARGLCLLQICPASGVLAMRWLDNSTLRDWIIIPVLLESQFLPIHGIAANPVKSDFPWVNSK